MKKVAFLLTVLLFLLSPLHAFLITWLRDLGLSGSADFFVSAWREIALAMLFLLALPEIISLFRQKASRIEFLKNHSWILVFLVLPLIFFPFQLDEIEKWLWGVRFDVLLFTAFLVFSFLSFSEKQKNFLMWSFLGIGFVVTVFGLIHSLFLPHTALLPFGYSSARDIWDVSTPIASCQPLEHTQKFCRAISTFGGPTRYGTYLLLLLSVSTFQLIAAKEYWKKYVLGFTVVLTLVNLLFTFSRSIWVALFVMVAVGLFSIARKREPPLPWGKIILTISGLFLIFLFFTIDSFRIILLRASSTSEHFALMKAGLMKLLENPLGLGVGAAGPASLRTATPLITENWYLQIGLEMGFLGLIVFLLALRQLFRHAFKNLPLFLALLGISVAGLFTHSFEETTTVLIIGALLGIMKGDTRPESLHSFGKDDSMIPE